MANCTKLNTYSYEEFMENSSKLNSLDHYSQLITLSKRIGYEISKVVFRGYHTSSQLQRLHDQVPTHSTTHVLHKHALHIHTRLWRSDLH